MSIETYFGWAERQIERREALRREDARRQKRASCDADASKEILYRMMTLANVKVAEERRKDRRIG